MGENQVAFYRSISRFGWRLSEPSRSLLPLCFHIIRRACGLSLPCQNWSSFVGIQYSLRIASGAEWDAGPEQNVGSKACAGHKRVSRCHPAITLVPAARLDSSHISQANSGPRSFLRSASYEIITCPRQKGFALNYKACFDSATDKTQI